MINITDTSVKRVFIKTRKVDIIDNILLEEARDLGNKLRPFRKGFDIRDEYDRV